MHKKEPYYRDLQIGNKLNQNFLEAVCLACYIFAAQSLQKIMLCNIKEHISSVGLLARISSKDKILIWGSMAREDEKFFNNLPLFDMVAKNIN